MKIINKKFSFIVIMAFLTLLSLQFNNCGQVDNPIKMLSVTPQDNGNSGNNGNNENPPYPPSPPDPDNTPTPLDPGGSDPPPPPGEDACDDYDSLDNQLHALRNNSEHSIYWRYGYYCPRGKNCINEPDQISTAHIAYYKGRNPAERQGSSNIVVYEIISNCDSNPPQFVWKRRSDMQGTWIYLRNKDTPPHIPGYPLPPTSCFSSATCSGPGGNSNFSDFNFSKVTWLDQNVSGWTESSRITSVQVKSNGQICTDYTERGRWPTGDPLGDGTQLVGNPWVFVKISGRYYAATYEWLRPTQYCKFGIPPNTSPLSKVYSSAWRGHIRLSPLKQWVARPGEVVGFMVSGFARHSNTRPNVRKRTNVQLYRLPKTDGTGGGMLGDYSDGRLNGDPGGDPNHLTCNSPNSPSKNKPARTMEHVVQRLATANDAAYKAVWDGSEYTEDYRFLDLVVNELHRIDDRFGYNCVRGDCNRISADALAYYRGEGNPNNSTDVQIIDFLAGAGRNTPTPAWTDVTDETCQKGSIGRWLYPRPGASLDDLGPVDGVCDENTKNGCRIESDVEVIEDNPMYFQWVCRGINGGDDSETCKKATPTAGGPTSPPGPSTPRTTPTTTTPTTTTSATPTASATSSQSGCTDDSECPEKCDRGRCVECVDDLDCPGGCSGGRCVECTRREHCPGEMMECMGDTCEEIIP